VRVSGVLSLFGAGITALIIADLWRNKSVTNNLINAGTTESKLIAGR
jgi:hypothetical protein